MYKNRFPGMVGKMDGVMQVLTYLSNLNIIFLGMVSKTILFFDNKEVNHRTLVVNFTLDENNFNNFLLCPYFFLSKSLPCSQETI